MANFIKYGMALVGFLALLVVAMVALVYLTIPTHPSAQVARPANQVTLRAATGNDSVQMVDTLTDNPNVTTFPDGWGCTKLGNRVTFNDGYGPMYFYKLDCGNKTGYVNAQWVR